MLNNGQCVIHVYVGHINNLNNTCIWKLVQLKGLTTAEAQQRVSVSELLLFFFLNYCLLLVI